MVMPMVELFIHTVNAPAGRRHRGRSVVASTAGRVVAEHSIAAQAKAGPARRAAVTFAFRSPSINRRNMPGAQHGSH